jgi:hypothetical protein
MVAEVDTAARMPGMRLTVGSPASVLTRSRAAVTAAASRLRLTVSSRLRWSSSTSGPMERMFGTSSSPSVKAFTPTTTRRPVFTLRSKAYEASAISPVNQPSSMPRCTPSRIEPSPSSSRWEKTASACRSSSSVIHSTNGAPPSGSATWTTPVSCATTCCVRRARRTAFSVGRASASSKLSVCSDCVPPRTPASASIATRAMLTSGCWAVSDTPAVWVWKRSWRDRSFVAP